MLTNEEDRECKAKHKLPGTYHVVINPDSFSSLDEYQENQYEEPTAGGTARSTPARRRSSVYGTTIEMRQDIFEDPDTLILGNFEENGPKLPTLGLLTTQFDNSRSSSLTSFSPATSYVHSAHVFKSHEASPIWHIGEDQRIASFYGTFVRSQLNQVHRDSLGTTLQSGVRTIPDVLDQQAPQFTPVSTWL